MFVRKITTVCGLNVFKRNGSYSIRSYSKSGNSRLILRDVGVTIHSPEEFQGGPAFPTGDAV